MSRYVLDASALLALLNDEPGAGAVASALADGSIIGSVNLSEAVAILRNNDYSEAEIEVALASVELDVPEFTRSHALQAGLMIAKTRRAGLSLGARACLALAKGLGLPALTGDRNWLRVNVGVQIDLLR